ncbi:hypothetical protein [Baaleninema sp.]|uniref:hypothetical protein n=1 Tax=Baaleninema sp. TaxID=3101197 RepID=UPI003D044D79
MTFAVGLAGASGWQLPAKAQLPECAPPRPGEYLLLVVSDTEEDPEMVRGVLAPQLQAQVCSYLDEVVVRVEGFTSQEEAAGLARSITQEIGLAAFVTRPPSGSQETPPAPSSTPATTPTTPSTTSSGFLELPRVEVIEARPAGGQPSASSTTSTGDEGDEAEFDVAIDRDMESDELPPASLSDSSFEIPSPDDEIDTSDLPVYVPVPQSSGASTFPPTTTVTLPTTPSSSTSPSATTAYNPQTLAPGYAVLVDYFNQTQVAAQVRQLTNQNVGLVSYGQRPFLLAGYTSNEMEANQLLQRLSSNGFWAMVVDSQRVMVIAPQVAAY